MFVINSFWPIWKFLNRLLFTDDISPIRETRIKVEEINFTSDKNPRELGMRIHNNKPRIVRRLFAHYGFEVEKLDRVSFAGLTKKRLNRGDYRHLDAKEVGFLKTR